MFCYAASLPRGGPCKKGVHPVNPSGSLRPPGAVLPSTIGVKRRHLRDESFRERFPPRKRVPVGVFAPAESTALAGKLKAANSHRAGTLEHRRKTASPERFRPGPVVFVSRLVFPVATLGVFFILVVAFKKGVGGCSGCWAVWLLPRWRTFFSSLGGARTAFASRPGPPTWREAGN
jgi:hypothetical protein